MCYKDELQKTNDGRLQRTFEREQVPQFITRYFINVRSKAGAINYWVAIRDLLNWAIEHKIIKRNNISEIIPDDMLEIESEDVTEYLEYKEKQGMSPATLNVRKNIFRSFWNYLVRTRRCPVQYNVITSVMYEGIDSSVYNRTRKCPKDSDLKAMEEKIKQKKDTFVRDRNLIVLRVLKGTGIREGELAGLDLSDVDFQGDEWGGPYITVLGKKRYRQSDKRKVYLTQDATNALREWMNLRGNINNVVDTEALFLNKNGKRLTESNIKKIFSNYGNGLTPHMIRHWYATVLSRESGGDLATQQQLGHSVGTTTRKYYVNTAYKMKDVLNKI